MCVGTWTWQLAVGVLRWVWLLWDGEDLREGIVRDRISRNALGGVGGMRSRNGNG